MNLRSTIIGIIASALLLAVLGFARLFVVKANIPDLEIREIETVTFEPPPPPPPQDEPPPDSPPPPPALTDVTTLPDPTRVPVPQAQVPMDITLPTENFFTDLAPAPLPVAPAPVRTRPAPAQKPSPTPVRNTARRPSPSPAPARTTPRPAPPPIAKSHYNANELDGTPRLLRHGSASFPSSLARNGVSRGTVTFEVELSTSGSVSVRRVVSSTHPELVSAARRVASGARFTPPKKNARPVKAIMRWPIVIEK